ncbi:MAG: hypothetical protein AAGB13_05715 [Cyanobacteria bacterium P01_F01_bin.33]
MTSTIPAIASIPWAAPLLDEANTLPQLDKPITFPERRETTPISSRVTMDWDSIAATPSQVCNDVKSQAYRAILGAIAAVKSVKSTSIFNS